MKEIGTVSRRRWTWKDLETLANLMNEANPDDQAEWEEEHDFLVQYLIELHGVPEN